MINELKLELDKALIGRTPQSLFAHLRAIECSRLAMMIIDSAIKNMPLEKLANTLLLTEEQYQIQLQIATNALREIINYH